MKRNRLTRLQELKATLRAALQPRAHGVRFDAGNGVQVWVEKEYKSPLRNTLFAWKWLYYAEDVEGSFGGWTHLDTAAEVIKQREQRNRA